MIQVLRAAGFAIDALCELCAPPSASCHPYCQLVAAYWGATALDSARIRV